jgi:exopolyphosphatase/guanosine-5'-triphosphate,3'-diphosphate pyrophosphatase
MIPEQRRKLIERASDRQFGRGEAHANQVKTLALKIYQEMTRLRYLDGSVEDKEILELAALMHDVGIPGEPHNEAGFDYLNQLLPDLVGTDPEARNYMPVIMYCVLWHNEHEFSQRGDLQIVDPVRTRRLAAIIRVADGLDRTQSQIVTGLSLRRDGNSLVCTVVSDYPSTEIEMDMARKKADLLMDVHHLVDVKFEQKGTSALKI